MAYSVDVDALVALCGSGDDARRRSICGRFRQDIQRMNDDLDCSNERGAPSVFTAIQHLVMGEPKTLQGFLYGYGFKFITEFYGRFLDNGSFYPCPSTYLMDTVDPALAATGSSLRTFDLVFRGAPVAFPPPDDFPGIGYWTAAEVAHNVAPVRTGTSREVRDIAGWLEQASREGRGIVGFYH